MIFGVLRAQGGRIAEEKRAVHGVGVDTLVVDPRRGHLDRPRTGQHLPWFVVAVAHHQAVAVLVTLGGEPGDIGIHLGLQRLGQHPPRTFTHKLIDQGRTITAGPPRTKPPLVTMTRCSDKQFVAVGPVHVSGIDVGHTRFDGPAAKARFRRHGRRIRPRGLGR